MERAYGVMEVVGVSAESYSDATKNAVEAAARKQGNLSWFETLELRGRIDNNTVSEYQVKVRIGYRMV